MIKDDIITYGNEIYNNKYSYKLVGDVKTKKEKFPIICPEHGIFYKTYDTHINRKQGCPECIGRKRYTNSEFIDKIKKLPHVSEYSFEKTVYKNTNTKIKIICHHKDENGIEHGEFEISPSHLLNGQGCPKCRYIKSSSSKRRTLQEVISCAREVHKDRYDYSLITEYKNDRIKYPIICPEHGIFEQTMNNHIKGKQGCPKCGIIKCANARKDTYDDFIRKAKLIHGDKFIYDDKNYVNSNTKIGITCKKHGIFYMEPSNHLIGQGCPKCAFAHSKGEDEIYNYITTLIGKDKVIQRDRTILNGEEIDIFIPSLSFAIEYNGLYWHSEISKNDKYHLNKTIKCNNNGIRLFHIFEDEWLYKKDIIKSMLKCLLTKDCIRIYARKCEIRTVDSKTCKDFLNNNHLQGNCNSQIRYGLYYNGELMSLMTFGKTRHFVGNGKNNYELLRFCNKIGYTVVGGASKLFKYFIKNNEANEIISYADRRWSSGELYDKLGFIQYNKSKPNYFYIINGKRVYRYSMRKSVLIEKYGCDKNMTEKEFCYQKGWFRIYDCGCLCYKWEKI
jgi:hypothetical protein